MTEREEGFTLVELVVVMAIIAILVAIGVGLHYGARERASDATARSNLRTAVPAVESYHADFGRYTGMTVAALKASYSSGIGNIAIGWTTDDDYCISSTVEGRTWSKSGPTGPITMAPC